ncbi:MAG: fibronectin type III domain-containing protein, partial [Dehalococcoidia bacterium]|nr:fibronectin type III domain-containing protein [Dehalococcoidia bacterium]
MTTPTAPGTPTEVFAIPSDVSAVVAWTAPTSDGGSPITLYTVTSVPGGLTATTTSTSTTVTGLTQNTAYTFTVTATNAAGTSASSEASPLVITKLTNIWNVPSTSGWGLAALVAGMFAALVVFLTKIRPLTN